MKRRDDKILIGGLDFDTDPSSADPNNKISPYDFVEALNLTNTHGDTNTDKRPRNMDGNIAIPHVLGSELSAGVNTCIGEYEAKDLDSVIYFVHNDGGNHGIYIYRATEGVVGQVERLMQTSVFGWTTDTYITGVNLVAGFLLRGS